MNEKRRERFLLVLLTLAVLAGHVWLLGGLPRHIAPAVTASHWHARTLPATATRVADAPAPSGMPGPIKRPAPLATARAIPRKHVHTVAATQAQPHGRELAQSSTPGEPAAVVAPPARWHYEVIANARGITLRGNAVLDWRHDGRNYEAQLVMTAPFMRERAQRSTGLVTPGGLAPLRFSDKSRSEEAVHFDRDAGDIVFSSNKPVAALEAGAQDRLSIILQLGAMLAGDPSKYPTGSTVTLQTASAREAEPWTFVVEGMQTLDLPGGRVPAMYLTRAPRREFDTKVELWLAPGATYAPVRLRLTQPNGDWVDQQWSSTDRG